MSAMVVVARSTRRFRAFLVATCALSLVGCGKIRIETFLPDASVAPAVDVPVVPLDHSTADAASADVQAPTHDTSADTRVSIDAGTAIDAPTDVVLVLDVAHDAAADVALDLFVAPEAAPPPIDVGPEASPDVYEAAVPTYMRVEKVSLTGAVFPGPMYGNGDCAEGAFGYSTDSVGLSSFSTTIDPPTADERIPSVFPLNGGVGFAYVSKNNWNGPWSTGLATWDGIQPEVVRIDAAPGTTVIDCQWDTTNVMTDGQPVYSTVGPAFVELAGGAILGTIARYHPIRAHWEMLRITGSSFAALNTNSADTAARNVLEPAPLPWRTLWSARRKYLRIGSTIHIYYSAWDGTTRAAGTMLPITTIAHGTTDGTTAVHDATPMSPIGWADPMPVQFGGAFYMVARRLSDNRYHLVRGTDPVTFDFAQAEPLYLHRFGGALLAWDEQRYTHHSGSGDPKVIGAEILRGQLHIFYIAGAPRSDPGGHWLPYLGGVGAFKLPLS